MVVSNSEILRYLNREIEFDKIKTVYEELELAQNEEEFIKIKNDIYYPWITFKD